MEGKPRVLFVCGRNRWRSPTAARIYARDERLEVRSAGVSPKSRRRVTRADLDWADLVLVMERKHRARLRQSFGNSELPPIESMEIPDAYPLMDPELVDLIRAGSEDEFSRQFGFEAR